MRLKRLFAVVVGVGCLVACNNDASSPDQGQPSASDSNGGATSSATHKPSGGLPGAGGDVATGARQESGGAQSMGGANTSGGTEGAAITGGTSSSGGASSETALGGRAAGGTSTGRRAVGGTATGGVSSGPATGGRAAGGNAVGGADTGGKAAGGKAAGGKAAGGKAAGGASIGGASTGGKATTGGAATSTKTAPNTNTKVSIYIAGDSTAQTYGTGSLPQQGWGQRLAEFMTINVTIVNKAMGGRSSKSYIDEGRLDEILKLIQPGDYLFAQWGINDRYKSDSARYTDPATTFRTYLKQYIDGARSKNAIPILLTPTPRFNYTNGAFQNDFPEYCKAIKAVGEETDTPVIDVQTKGLAYYTSVGYDYVSSTITLDVLHFKTEGAYQMARLVAEGISELDISLSAYVK